MPGIASSAPAVLIAHLASATTTLRVGSGGVMLPNHSAARDRRAVRDARGAAPGAHRPRDRPRARHRPDHRLRAAPLADPCATTCRRSSSSCARSSRGRSRRSPRFPGAGRSRRSGCSARSDFSARLAGELGLPFSFAHHFMPQNTLPRARALPAQLPAVGDASTEPYAMVGVAVVCAETDEQRPLDARAGGAVVPAPAHRPAEHASRRRRRPPRTSTRRAEREFVDELDGLAHRRLAGDGPRRAARRCSSERAPTS